MHAAWVDIMHSIRCRQRAHESERRMGRQRQRQGEKIGCVHSHFSLIRWLSQPHRPLVRRPITHRNIVCLQHWRTFCTTTTVHCTRNRPKCNRVRNSSMRRSPGMTENKIHIMKLNFHISHEQITVLKRLQTHTHARTNTASDIGNFVRYINCTREAIYRTRNIRIGWFTHTWQTSLRAMAPHSSAQHVNTYTSVDGDRTCTHISITRKRRRTSGELEV